MIQIRSPRCVVPKRKGLALLVFLVMALLVECKSRAASRAAPALDAAAPSRVAPVAVGAPSTVPTVRARGPAKYRDFAEAQGKRPLVPEFEVTETIRGGSQTLWLSIPELGLRRPLATSGSQRVCTVAPMPAPVDVWPRLPAIGVDLDCGQEQVVQVVGGNLEFPIYGSQGLPFTIAGKAVSLPTDRYVDYDAVRAPALPERECPSASPERKVSVALAKVGDQLMLVAPALKLGQPLVVARDTHLMACSTAVLKSAEAMQLYCSSSPLPEVRVWREQSALFYERRWSHSDGDSVERKGFRLPCGARVELRGVTFRGPDATLGERDPCVGRCQWQADLCAVACREKHTTAALELTELGEDCMQRCSNVEQACARACP